MNYYPRHIGDYWRDAWHLSMLEHGAYACLMDRYYSLEGRIPDDQKYKLTGARSEEERAAVDAVLNEFFQLIDGAWVQSRCEQELERARDAQESSAEAKINAAERQKRYRERRKQLSDELRDIGITPAFKTTNEDLEEMLRHALETRDNSVANAEKTDVSQDDNATVTRDVTVTATANQKPKAKSQKPNKPPIATQYPPQGEDQPHWWEVSDNLLARNLVLSVREAKHYPDFDPDEGKVMALLEFVQDFAPDDEAILSVVQDFAERSNNRRSSTPEYTDVIRTLRKWFSMREAEWRKICRQREIDADRAKRFPQPQPESERPPREVDTSWQDNMLAEARERRLARQENQARTSGGELAKIGGFLPKPLGGPPASDGDTAAEDERKRQVFEAAKLQVVQAST